MFLTTYYHHYIYVYKSRLSRKTKNTFNIW